MTNDLTKEDAEELIQRYEGHEHNNWYQSIMNVVVRANEKGFKEMKQMCDALLELMKDELEEMKAQGLSQGKQEQLLMQIEKKLLKGKTNIIKSVIEKYQLKSQICVILNITDDPIFIFTKEFIQLAAFLNCSIAIDYYTDIEKTIEYNDCDMEDL